MTIGQTTYLDQAVAGQVSDFTSITAVYVGIVAPLVGTLTILDGNGATLLTKTAGQSGAFAIAGPVWRSEYALSSASDMGNCFVSFRPI